MRVLEGFSMFTEALQAPLFSWAVPPVMTASAPSTSLLALQNRLENLVPQIERLQCVGGTVGMSIGVMSHGQIVLNHGLGFADLDRRLKADHATQYPIASLTKAFIASTIAQLVDEGLLDWEVPLVTYIPELSFESDDSLAGQLSLIDILSHRTGLARLDALWLGAHGQTILPKNLTIGICNHLPLVKPVRSTWLYNNWGYALAGEVIERVTNHSWGQVLNTRILERLNLSHTTGLHLVSRGSDASPYIVLDDSKPVRVGPWPLTDATVMGSAGGVRSTVDDLLKWGNTIISLFQDETPPIASLDTVLSGHSFINSTHTSDELYALGFAKVVTPAQFGKIGFNPGLVDDMPTIGSSSKPRQVFYHNGGAVGYNHCFMLIPELQAVIVVLTNSLGQGDVPDWSAQTLLQAVLNEQRPLDLVPLAKSAASRWRGQYQKLADDLRPGHRPHSEEPPHEMLLGTYWHTTGAFYFKVFQDGATLKFNVNGEMSQEHKLVHYSHNTFSFFPSSSEARLRTALFHYAAPTWLLEFCQDSSGKFSEIHWNADSTARKELFTRAGSGPMQP